MDIGFLVKGYSAKGGSTSTPKVLAGQGRGGLGLVSKRVCWCGKVIYRDWDLPTKHVMLSCSFYSFSAPLTVEQLLLLLALGVLLPGAICGIVKDGIVSVSPGAAWLFASTGQAAFGVRTAPGKAGASSNFCVPAWSFTNISGCF